MDRLGWEEFDYFADVREPNTPRPYISLSIPVQDSDPVYTAGIVDSGAERTLLDADTAKALGVRFLETNKVPVYGMGEETIWGYPHTLDVLVDKFDEPVTLDVLFVKNLRPSGLLGQEEFFTKFDVRFERSKRKFYLKRL